MGKLYMLIRPKKGKDPDERFKEMFENVVSDDKLVDYLSKF